MIERLAALCREHLLTEKILVAPSLAIGHQIADAVAHSGTQWVNLRVETIRTLSDAVAGFALASEGITVLSRAQALSIIERVCDRVLGSATYFAALADRPGLHRAIQKSIEDLGHAGLTPADLKAQVAEFLGPVQPAARREAAYSLQPGFQNRNRQVLVRPTGLPGTDRGQSIYVLRCGDCGVEYGDNGSGVHERKCPSCQGGRPGLVY